MGAVSNLARPDRNATGLSFLNKEIGSKRLELLVELLPGTRRVAILFDRNAARYSLEASVAAARTLNLEAPVIEIGAVDEFEAAYAAASAGPVQAIDILASPFFNSNRARLVELAARHRLPAMYESDEPSYLSYAARAPPTSCCWSKKVPSGTGCLRINSGGGITASC